MTVAPSPTQRWTAAAVPYSMSSGCATTHRTEEKGPSKGSSCGRSSDMGVNLRPGTALGCDDDGPGRPRSRTSTEPRCSTTTPSAASRAAPCSSWPGRHRRGPRCRSGSTEPRPARAGSAGPYRSQSSDRRRTTLWSAGTCSASTRWSDSRLTRSASRSTSSRSTPGWSARSRSNSANDEAVGHRRLQGDARSTCGGPGREHRHLPEGVPRAQDRERHAVPGRRAPTCGESSLGDEVDGVRRVRLVEDDLSRARTAAGGSSRGPPAGLRPAVPGGVPSPCRSVEHDPATCVTAGTHGECRPGPTPSPSSATVGPGRHHRVRRDGGEEKDMSTHRHHRHRPPPPERAPGPRQLGVGVPLRRRLPAHGERAEDLAPGGDRGPAARRGPRALTRVRWAGGGGRRASRASASRACSAARRAPGRPPGCR